MCRTDRSVVLGLHRSGHHRDQLEHALSLGIRQLDTAYNYFGFASHRRLARIADDLLPRFRVSTKVGFFARHGQVEHSLETRRLRDAVWQSVNDLGVRPAVIFLHSPERTLAGMNPIASRYTLAAACGVLAEAAAFGLCDRWGIASWDPSPLLTALRRSGWSPRPDNLMVRAGLSLDAASLAAAELLGSRVPLEHRWGMSPFAGSTDESAWHTTDLSPFLAASQPCTSIQAAFRLAYEFPCVHQVAVGTDDPAHLRSLVNATNLRVNVGAIKRYRQLIAEPVQR